MVRSLRMALFIFKYYQMILPLSWGCAEALKGVCVLGFN